MNIQPVKDRTVADYMNQNFIKLSPKTTISNAINILMSERLIAAFVINDDNEVVGILSEKDCLNLVLHHSFDPRPAGLVKDYMHEMSLSIPSSTTALEATQILIEEKTRRLPVIDNGKLMGQITRRNLIIGLHGHLFP